MKTKNQKNKGFTMIEIAIATSVLAIIFGGMTIFGVQVIKSNSRNQDLKNTVENVSYAIEFISKMARTSHDISSNDPKELFIKDNQENNSYCYSIVDNKLKRKSGDSSVSSCADIGSSYVDVAGSDDIEVDGFFTLEETDKSTNKRGFVQVSVTLRNKTSPIDFSSEDDEIVIQTLVSLRDYGFNP
jgi:prepilin-type N-terminal cleavage/methylation domain-containing protein